MTNLDIARQRLYNQHILQQHFKNPVEIVQRLGAVQAQDYLAAKWALGLRLQGVTDEEVEQAFNDGELLRTHVMRPTWHFVSPTDIRWLLALTAPRVHAGNASRYRQLEIDDELCRRAHAVLTRALQGGNQLTRLELEVVLQQAGIETDTQRLTHIIMHAELEGILCSGGRRGKQFTYALLEEKVPPVSSLSHDEALAELTKRYFTSHGPATIQDFVWWSGLTVAEARTGIALMPSQLLSEERDGQTYWFSASTVPTIVNSPMTHLLPNFDEYIVGYTDRRAIFDSTHTDKLDSRANVLFTHTIILDGQIVGTWKRTIKKESVIVTPNLFVSLDEAQQNAFMAEIKRLETFLASPIDIVL